MHHYPTSFPGNNCVVPFFKLIKSKYRITIRPPILWNIILNIEEKLIEKPATFKATLKKCHWRTPSYIFDTYIYNPQIFNKNFLNKKLEVILERLTRELMIRPKQSFCKFVLCQLLYFTFFYRKVNIVTLLYIFFRLHYFLVII